MEDINPSFVPSSRRKERLPLAEITQTFRTNAQPDTPNESKKGSILSYFSELVFSGIYALFAKLSS